MYCGAPFPEGAVAAQPSQGVEPPDLDRLIQQAMARGDTTALEAALRDHQSQSGQAVPPSPPPPKSQSPSPRSVPTAPPEPAVPPSPAPSHPPISIADTLATVGEELDDARLAWIGGDVAAVRKWAKETQPQLEAILVQLDREEAEEDAQVPLLPDEWTDSAEAAPEPAPAEAPPVEAQVPPAEADVPTVEPTILMPKVRHPSALVVEGMGDAEHGVALAEALGVDGVTARLIAVSRYPRFVFRGEDDARMAEAAQRVQTDLGIRAAVIHREQLLEVGSAAGVTRALTATPLRLEVVDRPMWDVDLRTQGGSHPREVAPDLRLAVVGEVVIHRFRPMPQGGRLKHIRETRVQGAGEERLAVADLHTPEGILRVVEGATELAGFPGHTPSAAVRSLRDFVTHLESLVPVMPRRVCQPGLDRPGGGAVAGQNSASQDTGWAAFEEHSRACRLLYKV